MKRIELRSTCLAAVALGWGLSTAASAAPVLPLSLMLQPDDHEEAAEEEDADEYLLLEGGDIYTGTGSVLRGAHLLSKNGVIEAIGYDFWYPEDVERIDCSGMRLYPGMVALSATSRITGGLLAPEDPDLFLDVDADEEEWEDEDFDPAPTAAELAAETLDSFDPFSEYLVLALAAGITTVDQGGSAIKLKRHEIKGTITASGNLLSFSWSSPDARRRTRSDFAAAAKYLRDLADYEAEKRSNKDAEEPSSRGINSSALAVLRNERMARFSASERGDLLGIARLAQEFGFRPVIQGGREAWTVADELGRAGATIILVPRERRWGDPLRVAEDGSSIENAALLHAAGCQVAVQASSSSIDLGGIAGRDLIALQLEAGFAIRGGLSNEAALQSITIVPARLLGADHRIGSLEVGKDADVLVTDGDLLHYETFVQYAVVAGNVAYDKQDELYYAHIRPRNDGSPLIPAVEAESESEGDGEGDGGSEDSAGGDGFTDEGAAGR